MILSDIVTGREPSTGKDTWPYVGLVMASPRWATCEYETEGVLFESKIPMVKRSSVSTGKLNTLRCLHIQPINLVVYQGTFALLLRNLVLKRASRLDAFSVYPFRS